TYLLGQDIFFFIGNIAEVFELFGTQDLDEAFGLVLDTGRNFAITNGADGVWIVSNGTVTHLPAIPLFDSQIINTIGAGDQFAAGFIAALTQNDQDLAAACHNGILAATK